MVYEAVPDSINDDNEIQENLRNLFGSVAKNNPKKSKTYREILEEDVAKKHQAFETMKEELKITKDRNAYKLRNFYKKINIDGGSIVAAKRAIYDGSDGSAKPRPLLDAEVCKVADRNNETLKPGKHIFDPVSCHIWYCRKSLLRFAEVDQYTCKRVADDPEVYEVFFNDCKNNNCLPEQKTEKP